MVFHLLAECIFKLVCKNLAQWRPRPVLLVLPLHKPEEGGRGGNQGVFFFRGCLLFSKPGRSLLPREVRGHENCGQRLIIRQTGGRTMMRGALGRRDLASSKTSSCAAPGRRPGGQHTPLPFETQRLRAQPPSFNPSMQQRDQTGGTGTQGKNSMTPFCMSSVSNKVLTATVQLYTRRLDAWCPLPPLGIAWSSSLPQ